MTTDEYAAIPELTMETMEAYVKHHRPTGDFLQAVFSNDLKRAVGLADQFNIKVIKLIVQWVVCEAPLQSQGSPEKYKAWIANKGE